MLYLSNEEKVLFAKICAYAVSGRAIALSDIEKKMACSGLKKMADNRDGWTTQQKEMYKAMVEMCEGSLSNL